MTEIEWMRSQSRKYFPRREVFLGLSPHLFSPLASFRPNNQVFAENYRPLLIMGLYHFAIFKSIEKPLFKVFFTRFFRKILLANDYVLLAKRAG